VAHTSRRGLFAALAGTILVILPAACVSSVSHPGTPAVHVSPTAPSGTGGPTRYGAAAPSKQESEQELYAAKLSRDRQSLDRGALSYSPIGRLKTGSATRFRVTVTDVGRGPQLVRLTRFDGMNVYQQNVPTRGIVGVQMVTCGNLTCRSQSGLRQPVLFRGQRADWFWSITAGAPGPALITLRADTYDQGSTQSLSEEIINIDVTVVPTPAFTRQQHRQKVAAAAKGIVGDVETIGSIASAVAAVGAIAGWIVMMSRRRRARDRTDRPAGPSPRTDPDGERPLEHAAEQAPSAP
jgi:hypothetical protein